MHALALNTYIAPFDETTKVFHLLHLFVEVDFHPFVDDFHLETKVILDQKTFILVRSPYLYSSGPSSMVYEFLRNCFVPNDFTSGFDLFFKACGHICRNPNLGLVTKARACKGAGQDWSPIVTFHARKSVGKCEGMNPHVPKWDPTLGVGIQMESRIFKERSQRWKPIRLISSLYH